MSKKVIESQKKVYGTSFREFGDSPQGTMQNNLVTQHLRYERLLKELRHFRESQFTIHDVGSGVCDLHAYLNSQNVVHIYSGTELVEDMIAASKAKFPKAQFFNRDIVESTDESEKYDFVVLSGTFNVPGNIPLLEWKAYSRKLLQKMYDMCTLGMSFNFLTEYKTRTDQSLAYFQPEEMFEFCMKNMSRFVVLDHCYPLFEGTITVVRPEALEAKYAAPELSKYFGSKP